MISPQAEQQMVSDLGFAANRWREAADEAMATAQEGQRPCILFKPRLFRDGDQWLALFGDNLQEGVAGFGDTPDAAMRAFDEAWLKKGPG